jgi:hypothetical protein
LRAAFGSWFLMDDSFPTSIDSSMIRILSTRRSFFEFL